LTALYSGLFLVCGAALLTITYLLVEGAPFGPPPGYRPPPVSGNVGLIAAVERSAALHTLLVRSGIALAIMGAASIWLGWIVAGRVLKPLREITTRARELSHENLHQRLALAGPSDEIKELSDTIDGFLARLEHAFDTQRRFVANASHELRTPLAMMRTSLDVADGKPVPISQDARALSAKVREGLDQADRLVESFLVLARAEGRGVTDPEPVSLPELVTDALDSRMDAIDGLEVTVRRRLEGVEVIGNEMLLGRLVANLIDNAVRYNQPAGLIDVAVEPDGPTARLTVESSGRVIEREELSRLGQPFRRLSADRTSGANGVGLGLAIVSAIAAAHHGILHLRARPDGGLVAVVELPRAQARADDHGGPA
jgi:signal transduction histidine kinase